MPEEARHGGHPKGLGFLSACHGKPLASGRQGRDMTWSLSLKCRTGYGEDMGTIESTWVCDQSGHRDTGQQGHS